MKGWTGRFLRINLTTKDVKIQNYPKELARDYIGGRGFAIKILWDELKPGVDPLGPQNIFIVAAGPLTGLQIPSAGKVVVAAKSPLTGGYGDGNTGTDVALQLRRAGYDAIIVKGAAKEPHYVYIEDDKTELTTATDLWGLGTIETENRLKEKFGKRTGYLTIGQAGENKVRYAMVRSLHARAGGRPGMGAVMGSKMLKAIIVKGTGEIPVAEKEKLKKLGLEGYKAIREKPDYKAWLSQGTMLVHSWCQENSCLPTSNFREGWFKKAETLSGDILEKIKYKRKGCPYCNMRCGNTLLDKKGLECEMDYENVGMLGSNIGIADLKDVGTLIYLADDYGVDTISAGGVIAFAMELSERKIIDEEIKWGDFETAKDLMRRISYREGLGDLLADGVQAIATKLGQGSEKWAMHVKGLDISAYDCHNNPGMALAYGTSPIGAHHKDAWVISWEIRHGRESYNRAKVDKVIEFQRIRGGLFETLTVCRFPWIELGFNLKWYPRFLKAATGVPLKLEDIYKVGDRIYSLIRAFWIREFKGQWSRVMDMPPTRWFDEPTQEGPNAGKHLDREGYEQLLSWYYETRGWDERGIPYHDTLTKLGLDDVAHRLEELVDLD